MQRRKFSREYKLEAVRLVRERNVSDAQAARDLDVHENVLRKWVKEYGSDAVQAFPAVRVVSNGSCVRTHREQGREGAACRRTAANSSMTSQLVTDALIVTIWRRGKPDALLHHPDQGGQGRFNRLPQHPLS